MMKKNNPVEIYVHHTAVSRAVQSRQFLPVNRYHQRKFGAYCLSSMAYYGGYQILIEPDGTEYRYREDNEEGCHTKGFNDRSLAVALAGHFDIESPTDAQIRTLKKRLRKWVDRYNISLEKIKPHRAVANTTCYGSNLANDWGKRILDDSREVELVKLQKKLDRLQLIIIALQKLIRRLYKTK